MRNLVLLDFKPNKNWNFIEALRESTKEEWESICYISNLNHGNYIQKIIRYTKYFAFPFKIFLKNRLYNKVIAWQQFYGIILAFYLRFFRIKYAPNIYIMTFIYKPKKGIARFIYEQFIKYSLKANCVKKIFVFSEEEPLYYSKIFKIQIEKFASIKLGEEDRKGSLFKKNSINDDKYYLSAGRSNRDYAFIEKNWNSNWGNLKIVTDLYPSHSINNIEYIGNCYGDDYLQYLSKCYAVILPLANTEISSGQLVAIQASMFGKPIISTESKTIIEYIDDEGNGLIIKKRKETLKNAIGILEDVNTYNIMCCAARKKYESEFTLYSMGINIGNYIGDQL